jgi:hypothetical protein
MHEDRKFPNPNPLYILRERFEAREYRAMRVGVPREIKVQEYRVGLTPAAVREYVAAGHSVAVETNAGAGIARPMRSTARPAPSSPTPRRRSLPPAT